MSIKVHLIAQIFIYKIFLAHFKSIFIKIFTRLFFSTLIFLHNVTLVSTESFVVALYDASVCYGLARICIVAAGVAEKNACERKAINTTSQFRFYGWFRGKLEENLPFLEFVYKNFRRNKGFLEKGGVAENISGWPRGVFTKLPLKFNSFTLVKRVKVAHAQKTISIFIPQRVRGGEKYFSRKISPPPVLPKFSTLSSTNFSIFNKWQLLYMSADHQLIPVEVVEV